jgi:hypothetical protein
MELRSPLILTNYGISIATCPVLLFVSLHQILMAISLSGMPRHEVFQCMHRDLNQTLHLISFIFVIVVFLVIQ